MKKFWQPENAFFDLVREKGAINAMLKHVGGKSVADANISSTAKVQKKIIGDYLTGEGRKKVKDWQPYYMEFPFKSYTKGGSGKLTDNADHAQQLMT